MGVSGLRTYLAGGGINRSMGGLHQRAVNDTLIMVDTASGNRCLSYGEIPCRLALPEDLNSKSKSPAKLLPFHRSPARKDDLHGTLVKRRWMRRDTPNQSVGRCRQSPPTRSIRIPSLHYGSQGAPVHALRIRSIAPLNRRAGLSARDFSSGLMERESRP
jgi:hypothetical protein